MNKTAVRCEGQIAEGRRCARKTTSHSGYCGVCKGKKEKMASVHQLRPAKAKRKRKGRRKVGGKRLPTLERAAMELATTYQDLLDKNGGDWKATWETMAPFLISRNSVTGAHYSGWNQFTMAAHGVLRGYKTSNWATYKQWKQAGGQVRKGSHGVFCFRPQTKLVLDKDDPDDLTKARKRFYYLGFTSFNIDDVDFPAGNKAQYVYTPQPPAGAARQLSKRAEAAGVKIVHQTLNHGEAEAFHRRNSDVVNMPPRETFENDEEYAATLLHELAHWTGDEKRCARTKGKRFGDEAYAQEELVAELVAMVATERWGIPRTGENKHNHASYLAGWDSRAGDDPQKLLKAAQQAGKALRYMEEVGLLPEDEQPIEERLAA